MYVYIYVPKSLNCFSPTHAQSAYESQMRLFTVSRSHEETSRRFGSLTTNEDSVEKIVSEHSTRTRTPFVLELMRLVSKVYVGELQCVLRPKILPD